MKIKYQEVKANVYEYIRKNPGYTIIIAVILILLAL